MTRTQIFVLQYDIEISCCIGTYITQVLITVYNATIYANFNNTIAFDSLKLAKRF
jgi:hypothetical protein